MIKLLKRLDLTSWDNWLPLAVIGVFLIFMAVVANGTVGFGLPDGDMERFHIVYTEIGIQTTAGIFAILISLSLVAIQFAAQEYSHRILDFYLKSVVFWSTVLVYLSVMVLGIILQARAAETDSLKGAEITLVGSLLALVLLVPHFLVTASYLKPEFIISKLLRRLDETYVRSVSARLTGDRTEVPSSSDRLLPVVEIIERSIDRGDVATTSGALDRILETYLENAVPLSSPGADRYFVDHLTRVGRKAVAQPDEEESSIRTLEVLGEIGQQGPASLVVDSIEALGFSALKRDSEAAVEQMLNSMRQIFDRAPADVRSSILATFKELVRRLATARQQRLLLRLAGHVEEVAQISSGEGDQATTERCLELLEAIGHDSAVEGMITPVMAVGRALQGMGSEMASAEAQTAESIIVRLLRIEQALNTGEREAIAAMEFAKGEIERALVSTTATATRAAGDRPEAEPALDVSDLWDEPEE